MRLLGRHRSGTCDGFLATRRVKKLSTPGFSGGGGGFGGRQRTSRLIISSPTLTMEHTVRSDGGQPVGEKKCRRGGRDPFRWFLSRVLVRDVFQVFRADL